MKQFIVLMAVLPILLLFLAQFTLEQKNHKNMSTLQEYVYSAKEEAKQAGCFTEEIRQNLIRKICDRFAIAPEEIELVLEQIPRYRTTQFDQRELIYYKVGVPIEKLMAGNKLLGISDEANKGMYYIESWTASEKIRE